LLAAVHESLVGTFRTSRHFRYESALYARADIRCPGIASSRANPPAPRGAAIAAAGRRRG
jgi:hypothetical protein